MGIVSPAEVVQAAVKQIVDPYDEKNRTRRWVNTSFIGLAVSVGGLVAFKWPSLIGFDNDVLPPAALFAGLGALLTIYSGLQLFLDGAITFGGAVAEVKGGEVEESGDARETGQVALTSAEGERGRPAPRVVPRYAQASSAMRTRLRREIGSQGRKAQTNLGMGVITALLSIGFLCWLSFGVATFPESVMRGSTPNNVVQTNGLLTMTFWALFASKLALSLTTSVFSFFFLSTYRRNLTEIKYFQNELNNIEARLFAIYFADEKDVRKPIEKMLLGLSEVERNFILKKGETTVEVKSRELDGIEANQLSSIIANAITPLLKQAGRSDSDRSERNGGASDHR